MEQLLKDVARLLSESPVGFVILELGMIVFAFGIGMARGYRDNERGTKYVLTDIIYSRLTPESKVDAIKGLFLQEGR